MLKSNVVAVLRYKNRPTATPTTVFHKLGLSRRCFNVLFFGRDLFSSRVFDELIQAKDILNECIVATTPDQWVGRRRETLSIAPLKVLAQSHRVHVLDIPEDKHEFGTWTPPAPFSAPSNENVLVTASFGRWIPATCLRLFDRGRKLNVHPSLLPAYRGAAPIQHALLDGVDITGVSVIEMEEGNGFDFGDIWAQKDLRISQGSTYLTLEPELARLGGRLLVSVLRKAMEDPSFNATLQDHTRATKARLIKTEQSEVDWSTWDATRVERTHRAIGHQRPVFTTIPNKLKSRLQLLEMRVVPEHDATSLLDRPGDTIYQSRDGTLRIACANGTELAVTVVKSENKSAVKAKEWWNGVPPVWLKDGILKLGSAT